MARRRAKVVKLENIVAAPVSAEAQFKVWLLNYLAIPLFGRLFELKQLENFYDLVFRTDASELGITLKKGEQQSPVWQQAQIALLEELEESEGNVSEKLLTFFENLEIKNAALESSRKEVRVALNALLPVEVQIQIEETMAALKPEFDKLFIPGGSLAIYAPAFAANSNEIWEALNQIAKDDLDDMEDVQEVVRALTKLALEQQQSSSNDASAFREQLKLIFPGDFAIRPGVTVHSLLLFPGQEGHLPTTPKVNKISGSVQRGFFSDALILPKAKALLASYLSEDAEDTEQYLLESSHAQLFNERKQAKYQLMVMIQRAATSGLPQENVTLPQATRLALLRLIGVSNDESHPQANPKMLLRAMAGVVSHRTRDMVSSILGPDGMLEVALYKLIARLEIESSKLPKTSDKRLLKDEKINYLKAVAMERYTTGASLLDAMKKVDGEKRLDGKLKYDPTIVKQGRLSHRVANWQQAVLAKPRT